MQKALNRDKQDGFTIVEVVLVLAIAGLIFLIVFLALPQLRRSQRDTQRKSDAGRVLAELTNYAGNNRGDYPTSATEFTRFENNYLAGFDLSDPSEGPYTITQSSGDPDVGEIFVASATICDGEFFTTTGAGSRDIAVRIALESGTTFFCQDSR